MWNTCNHLAKSLKKYREQLMVYPYDADLKSNVEYIESQVIEHQCDKKKIEAEPLFLETMIRCSQEMGYWQNGQAPRDQPCKSELKDVPKPLIIAAMRRQLCSQQESGISSFTTELDPSGCEQIIAPESLFAPNKPECFGEVGVDMWGQQPSLSCGGMAGYFERAQARADTIHYERVSELAYSRDDEEHAMSTANSILTAMILKGCPKPEIWGKKY